MADISAVMEGPAEAVLGRASVHLVGRVCLWFSIAAVTLAVVGVSVFLVLALAHHAAPAGGGG